MNYKDKEKVLREYRSCKLWEKGLCINEDFSGETIEIRKELFQQANDLRKKEKFTKMQDKIPQNLMRVMKNRKLHKSFLIKYLLKHEFLSFVRLLSSSSSFRQAPPKLERSYYRDTKEKDQIIYLHMACFFYIGAKFKQYSKVL